MIKKLTVILIGLDIMLWGCTVYFQNASLFLIAVSGLVCVIILKFKSAQPVGIVFIASLLSLSVAECIAPLLLADNDDRSQQSKYDLSYDYPYKNVRTTDLGQQPPPGIHASRKLTLSGDEIYNVSYSIGDDSFRITMPEKISVNRINFLGCSFTFGEGLNDDETLPYFVNNKLENVAVKNFGFHGWGAHQALALLQSERDTKGSINFFLTIPWHVKRSACKPEWSKGAPKYKMSSDGRPIRVGRCRDTAEMGLAEKALSYSKIYLTVQKLKNEKPSKNDYELYFSLVNEMATLSKLRGQKFIIGFIRTHEKSFGDSGFSNELFHARLTEIADEVIDLTLSESVKGIDKKYRIHKQDSHPTALANNERANLLEDVFIRHLNSK